jgi:hypothetical protein
MVWDTGSQTSKFWYYLVLVIVRSFWTLLQHKHRLTPRPVVLSNAHTVI